MAGAGDIRAGRAYVELGVDDKIAAGLKRAQRQLEAFGNSVRTAGANLLKLGGGALAGLTGAAKLFAHTGAALTAMSQRLGMGVVGLQRLQFVANNTNVDVEALGKGLTKLAKNLAEANVPSSALRQSLAQVGISVSDLLALSPAERLVCLADVFVDIQSDARRAALALELFGRGGAALLPMLMRGGGALEVLGARFDRLGLALSGPAVSAADMFEHELGDLWTALKRVAIAIGEAVSPALRKYTALATDAAVKTRQWAEAHREWAQTMLTAAAAVTALAASLLGLGIAASGVATALRGLATLWLAVKGAAVAAGAALVGLSGGTALALIAAALALGAAFASLRSEIAQLRSEAAELRIEDDRQRALELGQLKRLQALAAQHQLSTQQMAIARETAKALQDRYGDLGITIDDTASRVVVAANAFDILSQAMRRILLIQLDAEIEEIQSNLGGLREEMDSLLRGGQWPTITEKSQLAAVEKIAAKQAKEMARLGEVMARRRAVRGGGALAGAPGGEEEWAAAGAGVEETVESAVDWQRKLHIERIKALEDEQQRAVDLLNEEYDYERGKAEAQAADQATLDALEATRAQALDNLVAEFAKRRREEQEAHDKSQADEDRRLVREIGESRIELIEDEYEREKRLIDFRRDEERRLAEEAGDALRVRLIDEARGLDHALAATRRRLALEREAATLAERKAEQQYTIDELRLRLSRKGWELDEALLRVRYRQAKEKAIAEGENVELVNEEYALRFRLLAMQKAEAEKAKARFGYQVRGQFGGFAIERLAAPSQHQDRMYHWAQLIYGGIRDCIRAINKHLTFQ